MEIGQNVKVKVIKVDLKHKKIGLSIVKAVKEAEKAEYSSFINDKPELTLDLKEQLEGLNQLIKRMVDMSREQMKIGSYRYALELGDGPLPNGFTDMHFLHNCLPELAPADIDITTTLGGIKLSVPLFDKCDNRRYG